MDIQEACTLRAKRCVPCEGGVPKYSLEEAQAQIVNHQDWQIIKDGQRIRREWTASNFMAAMQFFNAVAELAEDENHHPDIHLEGYRHVSVEIWTHAIGGLSENDFILAAKIDEIEWAGSPNT
ncbi:MAG: pterin-4-alpha-carbinolamine dehydratase [Planctomycetaceae bacterium]|nr:pterin-4-alpha-carbinolamine dehydratase [Planctomycetaceae bacterium]|tara:strand:+ start:1004 stop:1372 length:369 start_codon:yes stop_codon:yes gene_type:complete